MEVKALADKAFQLIKKYRYAILILAIGLVLMGIPGNNNETDEDTSVSVVEPAAEPLLEDKLSTVLSQVHGAGSVQVILTVAQGEEIIYQTDNEETNNTDSSSSGRDTVTVTDGQRNQTGLIRQINPVLYQGAIVVCQGADDPTVRLAIVDAVSKLTGLGANRISVLKMK